MTLVSDNLAVVILAYGEAERSVTDIMSACVRESVRRVVVVGNDVPPTLVPAVKAAAVRLEVPFVEVVDLGSNRGSAGGYAAGIHHALSSFPHADLVLLLDDDNIPGHGCVIRLVEELSKLSAEHPRAVAARRVSRQYESCLTPKAARSVLDRGMFLGFDLMCWAARLGRSTSRPDTLGGGAEELPYLPWAPYGGLMLDRRTVERIGLPHRGFFMYGDDLDFTSRVVRLGGQLRLVSDALVQDTRAAGLGLSSGRDFAGRILSSPDADRLQLWLANEVTRHLLLVRRSPRLLLNIASVSGHLLLRARSSSGGMRSVLTLLRVILHALRLGERRLSESHRTCPRYPV